MSGYKDRLEIAKKSYISTDGPGEAGTRLWWCIAQVGHSYTNMDVENLRVLWPSLKKEAFFGKDWAYIIGHITQFFIIPTVFLQLLVKIRTR